MKIFDGYNVIGRAGDLGLSLEQEDKEERLLRLLSSYRARRGGRQRYLVVFDGSYGRLAGGPRKLVRGGLTAEWTVGESADDLIVRRLRANPNPRQVEVVSSDNEVLAQVRLHRGRAKRSEEFLAELRRVLRQGGAAEKPESLSPGEVDEWLALFEEKGKRR